MLKLDDKPIIIIGGGPGGYSAALEIRKRFLEQKIILIEKNKLGGACLHVGCIPSKQLHSIENLEDFSKLITKNKMILEKGIASELKAANIELIFDEAILPAKSHLLRYASPSPSSLTTQSTPVSRDSQALHLGAFQAGSELEGDKIILSNGTELEYCHLVIATGSKPRTLKEFPQALTSDSFFSDENLTKGFADKYCFIGGGYIGIELASMLVQHGKQVRIIEVQDNILSFLDKDIHSKLLQSLKSQKIKIETGVKDLSSIILEEGEEVFVSVGREPITTATQPPSHSVTYIGDASQGIALAHYAYAQAKQLAAKLAGEEYVIDKTKVPLVIFTHPELATIGLTEAQAREKYGDAIETKIINWASNGKARVSGADRGMTKWVIYNDKVIGCHVIGEHATDLISIVVPIINMNPSISKMQTWIYPHPTLGEVFAL